VKAAKGGDPEGGRLKKGSPFGRRGGITRKGHIREGTDLFVYLKKPSFAVKGKRKGFQTKKKVNTSQGDRGSNPRGAR